MYEKLKGRAWLGGAWQKGAKIVIGGMLVASVFGGVALNDTYADDLDFQVAIEPSLNVTLTADTVSLDLNPANAAFASQQLTASVGTNSPAGYTMTMSSAGGATALTRTEAIGGTTPTIATLNSTTYPSGVAESSFPANAWGYRFDNGNYLAYSGSVDYSSSLMPISLEDSAKTITFGAKVDASQTYGTYELRLVFTAVPRTITDDLNH